jgi:hypothetical protein
MLNVVDPHIYKTCSTCCVHDSHTDAWETEVPEENLPECHFAHNKNNIVRWETGNGPPELRHIPYSVVTSRY